MHCALDGLKDLPGPFQVATQGRTNGHVRISLEGSSGAPKDVVDDEWFSQKKDGDQGQFPGDG